MSWYYDVKPTIKTDEGIKAKSKRGDFVKNWWASRWIEAMEQVMAWLGGEKCNWGYQAKCCGAFLSVARPDIVTPMVADIIDHAKASGAECIVTACAMCHLNLEIRSLSENRIPVFHFSELLSLAVDGYAPKDWLKRHLIDPLPVLVDRRLRF